MAVSSETALTPGTPFTGHARRQRARAALQGHARQPGRAQHRSFRSQRPGRERALRFLGSAPDARHIPVQRQRPRRRPDDGPGRPGRNLLHPGVQQPGDRRRAAITAWRFRRPRSSGPASRPARSAAPQPRPCSSPASSRSPTSRRRPTRSSSSLPAAPSSPARRFIWRRPAWARVSSPSGTQSLSATLPANTLAAGTYSVKIIDSLGNSTDDGRRTRGDGRRHRRLEHQAHRSQPGRVSPAVDDLRAVHQHRHRADGRTAPGADGDAERRSWGLPLAQSGPGRARLCEQHHTRWIQPDRAVRGQRRDPGNSRARRERDGAGLRRRLAPVSVGFHPAADHLQPGRARYDQFDDHRLELARGRHAPEHHQPNGLERDLSGLDRQPGFDLGPVPADARQRRCLPRQRRRADHRSEPVALVRDREGQRRLHRRFTRFGHRRRSARAGNGPDFRAIVPAVDRRPLHPGHPRLRLDHQLGHLSDDHAQRRRGHQ